MSAIYKLGALKFNWYWCPGSSDKHHISISVSNTEGSSWQVSSLFCLWLLAAFTGDSILVALIWFSDMWWTGVHVLMLAQEHLQNLWISVGRRHVAGGRQAAGTLQHRSGDRTHRHQDLGGDHDHAGQQHASVSQGTVGLHVFTSSQKSYLDQTNDQLPC